MGDFENSNEYNHNFPDASFLEQYQDETEPYGILPADELLEKYNIKLISWDYTPPITNEFSLNKE